MRPSVIFAMLCAACGPQAVDHFGNGTDGGNGGGGGGGGGGGSGSNCASTSVTAQVSPLDIFIMLDQSTSMEDDNKWPNVTAALDTFVTQPNLTGFSAGIGYFGDDPNGFSDSCTNSAYSTPAVEIAALPAAGTTIKNSIAQHSPSTGTPTIAALGGAIDHAKTWAAAHPMDITAVVFATDGEPSECDTNLTHIDKVASDAYAGTPKIATFVIGVGSSLSNLNGIAAAGGTTSAYLVDTGANATQQFLAAMNAIRNSAACTYQIPVPADGSQVDYTTVNVVVTPPNGGTANTIPQVADKTACPATGDGWYYDNPATPTTINLCATSCGSVQTTGTNVNITLGCDTVIL